MRNDVLYTFRRCPYAIRARWAILISNVVVIAREVDLKNKPNEMLEASAKGTVPVLVLENGKVIDESFEIMKWAISKSTQLEYIINSYKIYNNEIDNIISENDNFFKYHLDRYKYSQRYPDQDLLFHRDRARSFLLELNSKLENKNQSSNGNWLVNNIMSLADLSIWPFVRQYRLADQDYFDNDPDLDNLKKWLNYFVNNKLFKLLMGKQEVWNHNSKLKYFPERNLN